MEHIMHIVSEWISPHQDERVTKCLHACVHKAREKEYEEFLSYQDDQVWKEMSEDLQQ